MREVLDMTEAAAEIERLTSFVDFVNLWCTRENLTNAERVSVIKHHPIAVARRVQVMPVNRAQTDMSEGQ